jgi:hypothetical protein
VAVEWRPRKCEAIGLRVSERARASEVVRRGALAVTEMMTVRSERKGVCACVGSKTGAGGSNASDARWTMACLIWALAAILVLFSGSWGWKREKTEGVEKVKGGEREEARRTSRSRQPNLASSKLYQPWWSKSRVGRSSQHPSVQSINPLSGKPAARQVNPCTSTSPVQSILPPCRISQAALPCQALSSLWPPPAPFPPQAWTVDFHSEVWAEKPEGGRRGNSSSKPALPAHQTSGHAHPKPASTLRSSPYRPGRSLLPGAFPPPSSCFIIACGALYGWSLLACPPPQHGK